MLYLSEGKSKVNGEWVHILKIGQSSKFKTRGASYRTDNGPNFTEEQVLGKRHGDKMLERMFHIRFRDKSITRNLTGRKSEWCFYSDEMYEAFFKETEESLGLFLWENRKIYLDPYRKQKGRAKKVYDYLKSIYGVKEDIIKQESEKLISNCLSFCKSEKTSNSYYCNSEEDEAIKEKTIY